MIKLAREFLASLSQRTQNHHTCRCLDCKALQMASDFVVALERRKSVRKRLRKLPLEVIAAAENKTPVEVMAGFQCHFCGRQATGFNEKGLCCDIHSGPNGKSFEQLGKCLLTKKGTFKWTLISKKRSQKQASTSGV